MASERVQRQIERLLDEAEEAAAARDWERLLGLSEHILTLDPSNTDANAFAEAARRGLTPQQTASIEPDSAPPEIPVAFVNGRYEVKRFLGEGGKKKVYRAHDSLLDRDVAFALIKTEGLDAEGRQRIQREAQAMGRLGAHPHIVSVFDLGTEGEQPFIVTELMGGGDVEALIEKAEDHKLPLERAIEIALETCQGLEFAHEKGIVHRDLKPGNVWLTSDPSTGSGRAVAKIGDFGLAVAVDKSRLTQAGMMVGTVSYMPPEQAMGGEVTARSDLYSLGAMLYEMVCGRPPFVGDESVAIIGQHLNTPPVAPSWHRPDVPAGLEALVLRLLEKDPSKRPTTASEVREALSAVNLGSRVDAPADAPTTDNPLYQRVFVGREQELKQLQQAFDASLSGRTGLAMVVGEPGIGKTSVCEQLATYAALRGGKALVGHCYEEGSLSLPYLPFVEAMRSYVLVRDSDDLRKELGAGASEVARIVSEVRDKVNVSPSEGGDPEEQRWRLLQAVTGFLRNAAAVQPLLIVLEDLHDADRGTLDLLLHLSRNLEGARLLIVGTYRDVEVDRSHPLSAAVAELRRAGSFLRVPLRGLTVDEVHRMYEAIRGQAVGWAQAEVVHRQTEGNPLFVQEVLRYLVEEGLVVREGGRYSVPDEATRANAAVIPEGLRDVVGRRLSHLSERANQVLSIAAVMGREFRLDVLQRVAVLPEEELYNALEEATDRAVVEQRQVLGVMGFRFAHAFFRQTLYEEIFVPRRIRLHQQVGRALEEVYGRRLDEHAAELAEHFVQSTETADLEKALHYCELAAQRATSVFAYSEAVRHLEQALRAQDVLDPDDTGKRCDLLLALGEAVMPTGEPLRAAKEVAEEAFKAAEVLGDWNRAALASKLALDGLYRYAGNTVGAMPEWRMWSERAHTHTQPGTLLRVYAEMASAYLNAEEEGLITAFGPALQLAREVGDNQVLFQCAAYALLGTDASLKAWTDSLALANELSVRPRDGVRANTLAQAMSHFASFFLAWGERERAEQIWREITDLAQHTHDSYVILRPIEFDIMRLTLDGELEAAVEATDRLIETGEQSGSAAYVEGAGGVLGVRARVYLGKAVLDGPASGMGPSAVALRALLPSAVALRALILAHMQQRDDARALIQQSMRSRGGANTGFVVRLLEAAVLCEDMANAASLAAMLAPLSHLVSTRSRDLSCVARHLGAASSLLGKPDEARAYYDQALEVCAKVRFRPEIALTRLQLAELLLAHYPEEALEAQEHLDFAIAEFREMKMQPSLERALRHKGLLKA